MNLIVYSSEGRSSMNIINDNLNLCHYYSSYFDAYDFEEVLEVVNECISDDESVTILFCKGLNLNPNKFPKYDKLKWYEV